MNFIENDTINQKDGYPNSRETLVKYLDIAADSLLTLTEALEEKNTLTPEKSDIKYSKSKSDNLKPKSTKNNAKDLQQWYTVDELAEECMEKFKTHCADIWQNQQAFYIEPSAGEGSILEKLPEGRRVGVDLEPKHDEVKEMNFFDTTRENLGIAENRPLVLIGNPPFGDVASNFFDHATTKGLEGRERRSRANYKGPLNADYIAWILPNSFITREKRNKIDPYYHLIYVMNITCCYVFEGKTYNLPTMFGIWKRQDVPIHVPITVLDSPDFDLITDKKDKEEIYKKEKENPNQNETHFWMRNVIQHIQNIPQVPTKHTAEDILKTYENTHLRNSTPKDKLLGCFCIRPVPGKYHDVFNYFSEYDWKKNIGQFSSGRSNKDWGITSRICISKRYLYSAYNNDSVFQPYVDKIDGKVKPILNEKSKIRRRDVIRSSDTSGGRRNKKKTTIKLNRKIKNTKNKKTKKTKKTKKFYNSKTKTFYNK